MSTFNLYTADGIQTSYTFSFPYLSTTHVKVFVNEQLQLTPMHYSINGSTVQFIDAPEADSVIEIKRQTSPSDLLVDFQDGSTLRESDLDTAYIHNFYLSQEYADGFSRLINDALLRIANGTGIVETDPDEVIAALVNELLLDDAAATLQQRVADIDTNAEAIIDLGTNLQIQVNGLAQGVAAVVYIQPGEPVPGVDGIPDPIVDGARWYDSDDNNRQYIYDQTSSTWLDISDPRVGQIESSLTVLQTEVDDNAAAIVTEQVARSNADSAIASELALLGAQNGGQTAFILDTSTVRIDSDGGDTLATRFSALSTADSNNAAAITAEETARISGDSANASSITTLSARVDVTEADTATNAADIVTEQTTRANADTALAGDITALSATVDLKPEIFYGTGTPTANATGDLWIDSGNGNDLYRWSGSGWELVNNATLSGNASAITALDTRVTTNEGDITSQASSITSLQSSVTSLDGRVDTAEVTISANTTASSDNASGITALEAKYGVRLDVNGYVTGFLLNNDGDQGNFIIRADRFAIIDPGATTGVGTVPFEVVGGVTKMQNVEINGNLILSGSVVGGALANGTIGATQIGANAITTDKLSANSITAAKIAANQVTADKINVANLSAINADMGAITAGTVTLNSTGHIKSGQTAYATGTGFWLGQDGGTPKFSIGNSTDFLTWDGTELKVRGNVTLGSYTADATEVILAANTDRTSSSDVSFVEVKKFSVNKPGTLRVYMVGALESVAGGLVASGEARVKVDGSVQGSTQSWSTTTPAARTVDITLTESSEEVTIEYKSGQRNTVDPVETGLILSTAELRGVIAFGEEVITD